MRILRVELTDFRGIAHADIRLDPEGVTIVEGPNEAGKSSIAEAIGLVRRYQDTSRAKDVLDVKPVGSDVGPQVEVEISTGDYHFVYRKRFVKKTRTELEVLTPRSEQLSGREAHERVEAIFAETLDPQLWDALQMVQGESFQQPVLARIAPLRASLAATAHGGGADGAGGAQDAGGHQDLLDRIDSEYATYFTPTGRPTGSYASLTAAVAELEATADRLDARLAGVDARLEQYEDNSSRLERIFANEERSATELEALQGRSRRVERLRERVQQVDGELAQARERRDAAVDAVEARRQMTDDLERRVAEQEDALAEADATRTRLEGLQRRIDEAYRTAEADAQQARIRETEHRRAAGRLAVARDGRELAELGGRVEQAEQAQRERDDLRAGLDASRIDAAAVDELLDLQSALLTAEAAHDSSAARVAIHRHGSDVVEVDGVAIEDRYDEPVRRETSIEIAGALSVRITPGRDPLELSEQVAAARDRWTTALERYGVDGVEEARAAAARRNDLAARLDLAEARLAQALGEDTVVDLTVRCRVLTDRIETAGDDAGSVDAGLDETGSDESGSDETGAKNSGSTDGGVDRRDAIAAAEQAVEEASRAATRAREVAEESRTAAQDRDRSAADLREALVRLQQKSDGARSEIALVGDRLQAARLARADDALQTAIDDAVAVLHKLTTAREEAAAALEDERPEDLQVMLDNELAKTERFATDRRRLEDDQQQILGQLADIEREGIQDQRDALRAELRDAERTYARMHSRAQAARLLRDTMNQHLVASQQRYVAPFRDAVERLGRIVFGADFTVEITPDLAIESRTQDGVTVPFGSLSGGAKEQLAVIGRLACAQLVSAADGAPVLLDDSLGFSDPIRLRRLTAVLNEVGHHAQIVILTCQPDRFGGIGSATCVRMPATTGHGAGGPR
ncbi:MAG: AAA family ATPase [Nocardioidaceae bacterium]